MEVQTIIILMGTKEKIYFLLSFGVYWGAEEAVEIVAAEEDLADSEEVLLEEEELQESGDSYLKSDTTKEESNLLSLKEKTDISSDFLENFHFLNRKSICVPSIKIIEAPSS